MLFIAIMGWQHAICLPCLLRAYLSANAQIRQHVGICSYRLGAELKHAAVRCGADRKALNKYHHVLFIAIIGWQHAICKPSPLSFIQCSA